MVSFLIMVIIHRDPSRFACPIVISHSTKADFFTRGYIKGNKQNICSFENDSKPSIGEIFECSQDVCGISGYAEVLPLHNALCRVHLRMGLKIVPFFKSFVSIAMCKMTDTSLPTELYWDSLFTWKMLQNVYHCMLADKNKKVKLHGEAYNSPVVSVDGKRCHRLLDFARGVDHWCLISVARPAQCSCKC